MAGIFDVGASALSSLQRAIATTGHNIANANTEGYSRQNITFVTQESEFVGGQAFGTGVKVGDVSRSYDQFLTDELRDRTTARNYHDFYYGTSQRVDSLFADASTGLSVAMDNFFVAVDAVATSPSSLPERQVLISEAEMLASRFNYMDERLGSIYTETTSRMSSKANDINQFAQELATLNELIQRFASESSAMPNDLLDKRDLTLLELSKLINVDAQEQSDGSVNVYVGDGIRLVVGSFAESVRVTGERTGDGRPSVFITTPGGAEDNVTSNMTGGELGAALDVASNVVFRARRELGLLAIGLASIVNTQHAQGDDLSGEPGGAFFGDFGTPMIGTGQNSGLSEVSYVIDEPLALTGDAYQIKYGVAGPVLTNLTTGESQAVTGDSVSIDGFTITLSEFAEGMEGDEFRIAPTADAAGLMSVVIRAPEDVAAAARGGSVGDNRNMLTLFDMRQTGSFINSNRSVDDIYRDTLSHVAVETRTSKSSASLEETLLRAATDRRDSIQGVNLEEEAADLVRYQQAYQAAAQVIAAANQVFDTLLRATER